MRSLWRPYELTLVLFLCVSFCLAAPETKAEKGYRDGKKSNPNILRKSALLAV